MGLKRASHCVYDTRYHLVWVPKYRKQIFDKEKAEYLKKIFMQIVERYEFEIKEMAVSENHIHIFLGFPPKRSIGEVVGILKSISARELFKRYPEIKEELWGGDIY